MVLLETKSTALVLYTESNPKFDIGIVTDRKRYNTIYHITLFGLSLIFEIVHYKPQ